MADPLSITLAVVSLTTALKDIIDLAQKLNDSFKKPGRNLRRAESLAAETLGIVQELKKFYDAHTEILDSAPDMQDAVLRLLKEMETVHQKCKPMLQIDAASDGKLHTWIKRKFGPWWKRNSVEESIRNLRDGANRCRTDFMMFALLRIEAATAQVQATTIEIRAAVIHAFARPHVQVSDDNFLAFLGSTPVILSQLPPHVKLAEHLVYKEYITLQVGKIDILFKALSSGRSYPVEEPDAEHLQQLETVIWLKPVTKEEIEDVQSNIFSLIVEIQDSIQDSLHNSGLSIQRGASAMSYLSSRLGVLDMNQESLTIARFAVDIYRTLTNTNEEVYGPHLAHSLDLVSRALVDAGESVQAYKAITEAMTLGRRLVAANPTFESQIELADLVCYSAHVARLNGDLENATHDAEEAVQTYERLIGQSTSVLQMEVNIINEMSGPTDMMLEGTQLHNFAQALEELHRSLSSRSRKDESVSAGIKALKLYSALEQRHNYPHFSDSIADLCYSLASDDYRDVISVEQALSYSQKAVSQYEKVLQHTGNVLRNLPFSLARQAGILLDLDRFEEAYVVCQKLQQIVHKHIEDHQLRAESLVQVTKNLYHSRRYVEAALVGEQLLATYRSSLLGWNLCYAYAYTSLAFQVIENHRKAVQIAESAVSYWRMLAFHDSENVQFLAAGLDTLACRLGSAGDYGRAFSPGYEAMSLYNDLIKKDSFKDSFLVKNYTKTLQLNMDIATLAKMKPISVERSREVIRYSRALIKQYPEQQMFHIRCILDHADMLDDLDQLVEASAAIEEALSWFESHPAQDADFAKLYTGALLFSARLLHDQGHPDEALSTYDKVIKVGESFADARSVASNILLAKAETLVKLCFIGRVPAALAKIEDCLTFAAEHVLEKEIVYCYCLRNVSLVYRCSGDIDKGISNMRRAFDILADWDTSVFSHGLSDLLADAGEDEEALIAAHETMQGFEGLQKDEEDYAAAQYSLSLRFFASNDFARGRELLLEVRLFYRQHSQTINLWFIKLGITLWALGNLECASGRHEAGIAARTELTEMRKRLQLIFPSLDDLVNVGLKMEQNFAAWKNLLKKINLTCGHQDLFEGSATPQIEYTFVPSDPVRYCS